MQSAASFIAPKLNSIKDTLFSKKFLLIMVLIAIFVGVAIYVYNSYVAPRINPDFVPNREFDDHDHGRTSGAEIYLFTVDWCPYSKKVKPVWKTIKKRFGFRWKCFGNTS